MAKRYIWTSEQQNKLGTLDSEIKKLKRKSNNIETQAESFSKHMPEYSERANNIAKTFLIGCSNLEGFNWRNKTQPSTFSDFEKLLKGTQKTLAEWQEFVGSPTVQTGIAEANKRIRNANRDVKKEHERITEGAINLVESDKFKTDLLSYVEQLKQICNIGMVMSASKADFEIDEDSNNILERLFQVLLIKILIFGKREGQEKNELIEAVVKAEESIEIVLFNMLKTLFKQRIRNRNNLLALKNPVEYASFVAMDEVVPHLAKLLSKFKAENINLNDLDPIHFQLTKSVTFDPR